jgi:phosphohistidine phosphatase
MNSGEFGESRKNHRLLCIVRHGKAVSKNINMADYNRPLTEEGVSEAALIARFLYKKGARFNMLISSPADRALETAHVFATCLQYPTQKILISNLLYRCSSIDEIIAFLKTLGDSLNAIAIFGHNPTFDHLAAYIIKDFGAEICKGAAVGVWLDISSWSNLRQSSGRLAFFIEPQKTLKLYQ